MGQRCPFFPPPDKKDFMKLGTYTTIDCPTKLVEEAFIFLKEKFGEIESEVRMVRNPHDFGEYPSFEVDYPEEVEEIIDREDSDKDISSDEMQTENKEASMTSQFINDVVVMKHAGRLKGNYWFVANGQLNIYSQGLYNLWSEDCRRRGVEPLKFSSLLSHFKEEPGFICNSSKEYLDAENKERRRCSTFNIEAASAEMKELIDE